MKLRLHRYIFVPILFACCWLTTGTTSRLYAQMAAVVNATTDFSTSHPWDDPATKEDETKDGICKDMDGWCTMRAAIEEATNMGVPLDLTINLGGAIVVSSAIGLGTLYPPDGSNIHGNLTTTIKGFDPLGIGNNTTISGLKFDDNLYAIEVIGDGNNISGNIFSNQLFNGINVAGNGNIIGGSSPAKRNIFTHIGQIAIGLFGQNNVVIGNFIGIDAQGDTAGNKFGVFVIGDNNTIGGTNPDMRNIISGNTISGIGIGTIPGVGVGTTVIGNYIGTDPTGTESRPNLYGIQVVSGHATIGGVLPAERNIISGNIVSGIESRGNALGVRIVGNDIGLDVNGAVLSNRDGVALTPGSFDCIVEGNRISNNQLAGILILGLAADPSWNHRIRGNEITRNEFGIYIGGKATDIVIGSSLTQDFDPNVIQHNVQVGVFVKDWNGEIPRANTIRKNDFLENTIFGIRVDQDNFPVHDGILPPIIQKYTDLGNGHATVTVTHDRVGALIDVYAAELNDSLRGEGRQWLGSGSVAQSNVPFTFTIDAANAAHIVVTATDLAENTSEFSLPLSTGTASATAQLNLNQGWNMSSVPVGVSNFQTSSLFPGATTSVFAYLNGAYAAQTTLTNGLGYWVQYGGPSTVSMTGTPIAAETIDVALGWNLVGSISNPIPVSSITSVPGGLVTSPFFEYNVSYVSADTIQPGKAYWVKTTGAGTLILSSSGNTPSSNRINIVPTDDLPPHRRVNRHRAQAEEYQVRLLWNRIILIRLIL